VRKAKQVFRYLHLFHLAIIYFRKFANRGLPIAHMFLRLGYKSQPYHTFPPVTFVAGRRALPETLGSGKARDRANEPGKPREAQFLFCIRITTA
jgi:hypothetical protein